MIVVMMVVPVMIMVMIMSMRVPVMMVIVIVPQQPCADEIDEEADNGNRNRFAEIDRYRIL